MAAKTAKKAAKPKAAAKAKAATKPKTVAKAAAKPKTTTKAAAKPKAKAATKAKTTAKTAAKPKAKASTFAEMPKSQEFRVRNKDGIVGHVRLKPNAVAWKAPRAKAYKQITMAQLAALAEEHGRQVKA